ncbi:hypothetical protein L195_g063888, partial [Trifolium pratense]
VEEVQLHTLFDFYLDGRFVETLEVGPERLRLALNYGFERCLRFRVTP